MFKRQRRSIPKRAISIVVIPTVVALSAAAGAAGPDRVQIGACIDANEQGQRLRDEGKITEARTAFIACSAPSCPAPIVKDCVQQLEEVERILPTATFRARDANGQEVIDVKVFVNGKLVSEGIDVQPRAFDPGAYVVRFERPDGMSVEQRILIRRAEKDRVIELVVPSASKPASSAPPAEAPPAPPEMPAPAAEQAPEFRIPWVGWVGVGLFGAGAATTTIFALSANGDESSLRDTCAPHCAESERSGIETKIVVANVGLGVALAGAALAVTSTILANTQRHGSTTASAPKRPPSARITATPFGVAGTF